jgi:RNA polymerase sigma-70 factor, ECF subfamily
MKGNDEDNISYGHRKPRAYVPTPKFGGHMLNVSSERNARTDLELVDRARAGDRDAFGQLISRHYHTCVRAASVILRDRVEAQDEVQLACLKAFQHLDQYAGLAQFSSWLIHIVVNECLMLMRSRRQARFVYLDDCSREADSIRPPELPARSADPESQAVNKELLDVLKREIRRSPPLFRTILVMREIQELPMPEVAHRLGITVPAAKSRLLRARIELKERVMRSYGHRGGPALTAARLPAKSGHRTAFMA